MAIHDTGMFTVKEINRLKKKPSAARITDRAGAEPLSGKMLLLALLKVLYLVINRR
ncbi:hypothetical protein O3E70_000193 [Salmonella enterica]|nr:hypothetical protein [Salmonella enterica]